MVETTFDLVVDGAARTLGLSILAGGTSLAAALAYRWYGRTPIPEGVAVLLGVGSVALWLNTTATLEGVIGGNAELLEPTVALFTIAAFALAGIAADVGRRVGDRVGVDAGVTLGKGSKPLETDVGALVRSAGRVTRVTLPETIEDADGYDPIPADRKEDLSGTTLLFPQRLTVSDLRERLKTRLKDDYGIGYVDFDLTTEGRVERLVAGRREAGLGRTLPPGTVAVAVSADPAFSASPGDAVEVWTTGDSPARLTTAELRATAGDVVTLVVDEPVAREITPEATYRIVTLPRDSRADQELLSALRRAPETAGVLDLHEDHELVGKTVGDLDLTVVAVSTGAECIGTPDPARTLAAGDYVHVIGPPDRLREYGAALASEAQATS